MKYYVRRNTDDAYLVHYGVKGMKWGVRKAVEYTPAHAAYRGIKVLRDKVNAAQYNKYVGENGKLTAAGRARFTDDKKRKDLKTMSNKDLKKSAERLAMENKYKAAIREERNNKMSVKIAKTAVKAGLAFAATKASISLLNAKIGKGSYSPSYSNKIATVSALIAGFSEWGINETHLSDIYKTNTMRNGRP